MVELEFHCAYCGEQNEGEMEIDIYLDENYDELQCVYCKKYSTVELSIEYKTKTIL